LARLWLVEPSKFYNQIIETSIRIFVAACDSGSAGATRPLRFPHGGLCYNVRMKFVPGKAFFLLIAFNLSLSTSCTRLPANQNVITPQATVSPSETPPVVNDDVSELAMKILLPEIPEEAVWKEQDSDRDKKKMMIAVLRYDDAAASRVVAQAEKVHLAEPGEIEAEDWFPAELTALTQLSGNEMLKGDRYSPSYFLNVPYTEGVLFRVEKTNFFIVELHAN
jgi:hypothetical protein